MSDDEQGINKPQSNITKLNWIHLLQKCTSNTVFSEDFRSVKESQVSITELLNLLNIYDINFFIDTLTL